MGSPAKFLALGPGDCPPVSLSLFLELGVCHHYMLLLTDKRRRKEDCMDVAETISNVVCLMLKVYRWQVEFNFVN